MTPRSLCSATIVSLMLLSLSTARAAEPPKVSVTGVAVVKRPPEIMRMMVDLTAQGKTPQEALANLNAKRDASKAKALDLGASKASITASEPRVAVVSDRQRQMEMMVRQRMRQSGRKPSKKQTEQPISLTLTFTADWPLKTSSADELLIDSETLARKIKGADISGAAKDAETASAEDQETAEENAAMENNFGQQEQQPGEPRFVFLSKISKQDEDKALAQAFDDAKARATQLARASGATLGSLLSISGGASNEGSAEEFLNGNGMYDNPFARYQMMQQQALALSGAGSTDAAGPTATTVVRMFSIQASFGLKQ